MRSGTTSRSGLSRTILHSTSPCSTEPSLVPYYAQESTMATSYFSERGSISSDPLTPSAPSPSTPLGSAPRISALSTRITSVLSSSHGDLELRDALETLDARGLENTPETRRNLRLDIQREVIQCNGEVIEDFGKVAEVARPLLFTSVYLLMIP